MRIVNNGLSSLAFVGINWSCMMSFIVLLPCHNVMYIRFLKSQMILTLIKLFRKINCIDHTKYIPYENIHREEFIDIDFVF
jgi:hypothetical protein